MTATVRGRLVTIGAPLGLLLLILVGWQVVVVAADVSALLLPSPTRILDRAVGDADLYLWLTLNTALDALTGTAAGVLIGIAAAWAVHGSARVSASMSSGAIALNAMPIVALFPLITTLIGDGRAGVATIVAFGSAPIMFAYTVRGLRSSSLLDELMVVIGAGRLRRVWSLRLPQAVPYLLTGLATILPGAVIGAIVAEYFGGSVTTLGAYIRRESGNLHTTQMWAAIVFACVLGLTATLLGVLAEAAARRSGAVVSSPR